MKRKEYNINLLIFLKLFFYDLNFHAPIIDIIASIGINIAIPITLSQPPYTQIIDPKIGPMAEPRTNPVANIPEIIPKSLLPNISEITVGRMILKTP